MSDSVPTLQLASTDADLLPVVNERDEVIAVLPRRQVHLERRLHRAVHVCVIDAAGRIVMQQRSPLKDTFPGYWDWACTGHVDPDETYDETARRELVEELGIVLPDGAEAAPQLLFKCDACEQSGWEFLSFYALRWTGPVPFNPHEISQITTITLDELEAAAADPASDFLITSGVRLNTPRLRSALPPQLTGPLAIASHQ